MTSFLLLLFGVVFSNLKTSEACNGYRIEDAELKPCSGSDNLVKVSDYNIKLTTDCKVVPSGCFEFTKDINKLSIDYEVSRNSLPFKQGTVDDACREMDHMNDNVKLIFNTIGVPTKCPMKAGKICGSDAKAISIQKHALKLPGLTGTTAGKITLKTDNGQWCFKFSHNLVLDGQEAGKALLKNIPGVGGIGGGLPKIGK